MCILIHLDCSSAPVSSILRGNYNMDCQQPSQKAASFGSKFYTASGLCSGHRLISVGWGSTVRTTWDLVRNADGEIL